MPTFIFDKLVRDKVLERCLEDPKVKTNYRTLDPQDYKKELIAKIHEETNEVPIRDIRDDEIISELADVQTVIDALLKAYGISSEQLLQFKEKKFAKNGGFEKRAYIASIDLEDDSEWIEVFRSQPEKYREL
jgi:predicted house-cleaning noncanonical NTP pyrophosphatase (MazG superfamily)